jgi:hypothetical protein
MDPGPVGSGWEEDGVDLGRARPWARAAGVSGMAADVLLIAFYAVEVGR